MPIEAGFGETVLIGRALKGARHRRGAIFRVARNADRHSAQAFDVILAVFRPDIK